LLPQPFPYTTLFRSVRADYSDVERLAGLRLYHRHQRLAKFIIGNAEYGAIVHARDRVQRRLDFGRIDIDTARDHHVALAIADEDITVLVDIADVARGDKTIVLDLGPLLRLVVIGEVRSISDPRIDLPDLALGQHASILAEEAKLRA